MFLPDGKNIEEASSLLAFVKPVFQSNDMFVWRFILAKSTALLQQRDMRH